MMKMNGPVLRRQREERKNCPSKWMRRVVLIAAAGFLSVAHTNTHAAANKGKTMVFSPCQQHVGLGDGLRLTPKEKKENSKRLRYSIKARFPYIEEHALAKQFNQEVAGLISKEINRFKEGAEELAEAFKDDPTFRDIPSSLDIDYCVHMAAHGLISILFYMYEYGGGAHGSPDSLVLNYDLTGAHVLSLGDLFKPSSRYLKAIADYCINSLKKRGLTHNEHIDRGASEGFENYKSWNITPNGLLITFDPYQVASYAEGAQQVIIPFAVLRDILKPRGYIKIDKEGKVSW